MLPPLFLAYKRKPKIGVIGSKWVPSTGAEIGPIAYLGILNVLYLKVSSLAPTYLPSRRHEYLLDIQQQQ